MFQPAADQSGVAQTETITLLLLFRYSCLILKDIQLKTEVGNVFYENKKQKSFLLGIVEDVCFCVDNV